MDEQKLIHDPPQKVLALYQAVIEFINEGCDINTLKVADITGWAGIGKGTAYVKVCFEKLQVISTDNRTFQQKINEVMDFIDEHVKEKQGVFFLIKMVLESYEIPKNLKDEYERMKQQCCDKEKNEIIDCIVEEGVREGLIREENVFLRRAAVETQLSVYFMYRIAAEKKIELDLEADFLREYVYQNLLKLLG